MTDATKRLLSAEADATDAIAEYVKTGDELCMTVYQFRMAEVADATREYHDSVARFAIKQLQESKR